MVVGRVYIPLHCIRVGTMFTGTCASLHQWWGLSLGRACPRYPKTWLLQCTPHWSLPTSTWQATAAFRTVQPDWWRDHAPREEGLSTSPSSCNNYTGLLYDSKFLTSSAYLLTTACMVQVLLPVRTKLHHHVRDLRLRLQKCRSQSITPDGKSGRAGFGVAGPLV